MTDELKLNLNKQYRKLSYPCYIAIRTYKSDMPHLYQKNAIYSIMVKGTKMMDARLVALNITPMKDLSTEVTYLDCDLKKEEFINKYSSLYVDSTLMAVMVFIKV